MYETKQFDVIIIGGGLAGISCSFELQDNLIEHILLEKNNILGGQIPLIANRIRNLAGVLFENGTALQNVLNKTAVELKLPLLLEERVVAIDLTRKTIKTNRSILSSRAIVLATGARLRKLELKDENQLNDQVVYMVEGKESQLQGRNAVIVGGGDSALIEAVWFAKNSKHVTLIHKREKFHARPDLIEDVRKNKNITIYLNSQIQALFGQDEIEGIVVKNTKSNDEQKILCNVVVAKIGSIPNTELFRDQIDTDLNGHIKVNEYMETSKLGVYAVGDVTSPAYWRLAVAAGQGSIAARSIMKYLWK